MKASIRSFFDWLERASSRLAAGRANLESQAHKASAPEEKDSSTITPQSEVELLKTALRDTLTLVRVIEERSRSLEYEIRQTAFATRYQIDLLQKLYMESTSIAKDLQQKTSFNASHVLDFKTDYPIAIDSNDHLSPGSTVEGITRPTLFVQDCITILGQNINCLDLGTGAAGLVFEYAMSDVLAVGIDGSDFCQKNRIGYWPVLKNNLFTCDITKPFSFLSRATKTINQFDIITTWEVLEHINESDLPHLFQNIHRHLDDNGYFIGSISLIEYSDDTGKPYHVTLKPRDWWKAKFIDNNLTILDTHPFNERFFCRGNGPRFQDFHNYALNPDEGFLFVAQKSSSR